MQRWDDEVLHDWRRPLAFAADDDEDDEEDIFNEDGIADPEEEPVEEAAGGDGGEASGEMKRPLVAAIFFALLGLLTPVLLFMAMKRMGMLAWPPFLMLIFSMMGALAAIGNLVYTLTKGKQYAIPFSLRTFFRWHELAAICALLVPLAVINLAAIPEGTHFTLRRGIDPGYSLISMIKALPHTLRGELVKGPAMAAVPPEATGGLFLHGALWGVLGYAMALGLAGMLFAAFRKMTTPFGPKLEEKINDSTGEIDQVVTEGSTLFKILDIPYRMLIGYSAGTTIGLVLGFLVIGLHYLLFLRHGTDDATVRGLLTAVGASTNPDLAFAGGFSLAGLIVPLAFLTVGKFSPPGASVSEAEVKARYVAPAGSRSGLAELPAPAMISFGDIGPDHDEDLLADMNLDASLTEELLSEFGDDLEAVFGLEATNKTEAEIIAKKETMDRSQVAAIVEQSFGELGQIQVEVAAELGRASMALHEWLHLQEGTLIELNAQVGSTIDLYFNGVLKGRGSLTVADNHIGVQVTALNLNGNGGGQMTEVEAKV